MSRMLQHALPAVLALAPMVWSQPSHASLIDLLLSPTVSFTAASSGLNEGAQGSVQIRLSSPARKPVTVSFGASGTAQAGADYSLVPATTVSFARGESLKTIAVKTVDDTAVESAETVVLRLAGLSNARSGRQTSHTVTIADNDTAPLPTLSFAAAAASAGEATATTVELRLSAASTRTVTVAYTASGSAAAADYALSLSSPVSFAPGETRKTLGITPVDDSADEPDETLILTLGNAANATLGGIKAHTRTIVDDDEAPVPATSKWVMGYYVGYARGLYPVEVVDFSALTHVVVGRITPNADGTLTTNFDIDDVEGPAWARDVVARAHAAGKKAIVMVGGFGEYDDFVSAASSANRARFIQSLVQVANEYGFDGWDLDWEPIETADQPNMTALAQGLRSAAPARLITVPIYWINANFPDEADPYYAQLAGLVDQINVMSYGMASGYWNWDTWHSSAIFGETGTTPSSIDSTVRNWLRVGVPAAKLGIGIGFYGSCWRGVTEPYQSMEGTSTGGLPRMGNDDNDMSYTNIMTQYYTPAAKKWHEAAKTPYLGSSTPLGPQKCNFVSYEDAQSIAEKAAYVKSNNLGGAIVWTINQGYLPNAPAGQRDPLMQALKDHFLTP